MSLKGVCERKDDCSLKKSEPLPCTPPLPHLPPPCIALSVMPPHHVLPSRPLCRFCTSPASLTRWRRSTWRTSCTSHSEGGRGWGFCYSYSEGGGAI